MTHETDIVPHEGAPWTAHGTFADFQRHMHRSIAQATAVKPIHIGLKTCLSCGSLQSHDGSIPCGH